MNINKKVPLNMCIKGLKSFLDDRGQMSVEFFIALPAFIIALVVFANLFMFISAVAKADRLANEITREIYQSPNAAVLNITEVEENAFQKKKNRHYLITVSRALSPDTFIENRQWIRVSVRWFPFASSPLVKKFPQLNISILRTKSLYAPQGGGVITP